MTNGHFLDKVAFLSIVMLKKPSYNQDIKTICGGFNNVL